MFHPLRSSRPMANAAVKISSPIHIIEGRVETGYDRGSNRIKRGTFPSKWFAGQSNLSLTWSGRGVIVPEDVCHTPLLLLLLQLLDSVMNRLQTPESTSSIGFRKPITPIRPLGPVYRFRTISAL